MILDTPAREYKSTAPVAIGSTVVDLATNSSSPAWTTGSYLTHRFNPELGIGRITAIERRALVVEFPRSRTVLRVADTGEALVPVDLSPGRPVRISADSQETTIAARLPDGTFALANGRTVSADELWPLELEGALLERLAIGDLDDLADFVTRINLLHLLALREADGLGSFLGGRVRLFPHQLYVAERATASDPVRWLLADEVGLGKTIEASLILNRLVHAGQVTGCLVVAPDTLTVQWLGELWRKYHQVFTLLDADRLADVARDFGADFNPFELHRRAVISIEMLIERPHLTEQAVRAGIDLLVVDEAQHLRRPQGHPGEAAWRAVAPIAALGRHVLLLSATPLEDDAHGFFRLLQLLRADDFPEDLSIEARLAEGTPFPACTSATRRADIGGLPPRVGIPIEVTGGRDTPLPVALETAVRSTPATHVVAARTKIDRVRRALASGAALVAALGSDETALRTQALAMDAADPRVEWLVSQAKRWRAANEKTLVFVAHRETLEMLRTALSQRAHLATGVFHELLTPARRDTEVARFRELDGPSLLVSTECGGEGRNFEFCRRLVLFDLPWKPSVVEQRIGRLDRIGRRMPVEVVYFRPPAGIGRDVVRLFEALGLFGEPLAGIEPQLALVEGALEEIALDPEASLTDDQLQALVAEAHAARTRIREAAYQQLHRDPYRPEMAAGLLGRIPAELDELNQEVVVTAAIGLGFTIAHPSGHRVFSIELGAGSSVDGLPGVPGGSGYVGTFDREEAVANESIDFFASGHPLVEGIFAHYDESPLGRAVRCEITLGTERGSGLVAIYREQRAFEVIAIDAGGNARPDWAAAVCQRPVVLRPVRREAANDPDWRGLVRRLGAQLDPTRRLYAVAAIEVRPSAAMSLTR
ncbi:MAG TPA: helicase-related protein [Vicinamibacterales bacterium]|nr:helicase-related protein [Vicinamibacterales bacterium]